MARLGSVQYLRAIAALAVVAFHVWKNLLGARPDFNILRFGEFGVDLFFVISGFIITTSTTNEASPTYFIAKRAVRIIPLYWLVTVAYLVIGLVAPNLLRSTVIKPAHVISSFLFVPSYHPVFPTEIWPLVIPGWSLNYEWFFYLVFAIAIALNPRHRAVLSIGFLTVLVGLGLNVSTHDPIVLTYTDTLLIEFIFGVAVGEIFIEKNIRAIQLAIAIFLFVGAVGVALKQADAIVWQCFLYGSMSAALLSTLLWFEKRGRRFANRVALGLGDASYSIYLTHVTVIAVLRTFVNRMGIQELGSGLDIAILGVALSISALIGWIIFVLIERPLTARLNAYLRSWRISANAIQAIVKAD